MRLKCANLADVVRRLGYVIRRGIRTLILVRAVLIHQALLAVTELQEQYLRYVVAGRLLVLVINVQLVIQVHLIIAMFTALVMVIAVQMVHINLVIRYVAVVGVVLAGIKENVVMAVVHHHIMYVLKIVIILSVILL